MGPDAAEQGEDLPAAAARELDEETGEQVLALLDSLTRQAGKNLVMVTHSRENCHRGGTPTCRIVFTPEPSGFIARMAQAVPF